MSLRIKKNDTVYVRAGNDKGKTGRVLMVMPAQGKALVEGINMIKRHERRGRKQGQQGGIVSREAPVPLSRLMLMDSASNAAGRFRVQVKEDGTKVRVHTKTGKEL